MATLDEPLVQRGSYFRWPAIFAGAVAAAGVSITLHAFAAGIGLSVASTAPTWRDSSAIFWILTGLYLVFVALVAFAVGGYVAGRMGAPLSTSTAEMEFRDGVHGLVMWGLAILVASVLALGLAAVGSTALNPSAGTAGASQSVAGENIIASELDTLYRSDRSLADLAYRRAEAARILLKASGHSGVTNADRRYLSVVTANVADLSLDAARERVDRVVAMSAQELHRARVAAVLQAFFVAAALLIGAVIAWFAACEGGRDRERGAFPAWGRARLV